MNYDSINEKVQHYCFN